MTRVPAALPLLSEILGLRPGDMVAVMGAGGKATATKRLVCELVEARTPVLVTGTTNLHSLENWSVPLPPPERDRA